MLYSTKPTNFSELHCFHHWQNGFAGRNCPAGRSLETLVYFILGSFLYTHGHCQFATLEKTSCIVCFTVLLMDLMSLVAATNKPMNFVTQTAQSQATSWNVTTGQNFLVWSLHGSNLKLMPEWKGTAIRRKTNWRESVTWIERCYRRACNLHSRPSEWGAVWGLVSPGFWNLMFSY